MRELLDRLFPSTDRPILELLTALGWGLIILGAADYVLWKLLS